MAILGPVKQLACRICKHLFYLTKADYDRLQVVHYCHECSLILREELESNQMASDSLPTTQTPLPAALPFKQTSNPTRQSSEQASISRRSSIPVPQPRTIDRDKMKVAQLLEEAQMLDKTWRYKEALASYEQAPQRDQGCQAALYGKGEMLRQLNRPAEAKAANEEILRLDPKAVQAAARKGWALSDLRRYEEALAAFDEALQLDPSASEPENGKDYIFTHIFHRETQKRAASPRKSTVDREMIARHCQSARDYYEVGCQLIALDRDDEAFRAFARSIELDPLDLDVYEYVARLYFIRENHEEQPTTSLTPRQDPFSANQVVWPLIKQPEELDEHQRDALTRLCRARLDIEKAYQLAQRFRSMLRNLQGEHLLDGWLQNASQSGVPQMQQFAAGLQRDKAAVQAGLSLPYSTGPIQGHLNRLTLLKRSMYGRAQFALLRQRVLLAS
jgi:tetratricopeptide (TPR) repeat protein